MRIRSFRGPVVRRMNEFVKAWWEAFEEIKAQKPHNIEIPNTETKVETVDLGPSYSEDGIYLGERYVLNTMANTVERVMPATVEGHNVEQQAEEENV